MSVFEDRPSTSTGVFAFPAAIVETDSGSGPPRDMTPPSSLGSDDVAARAAIPPCPKPKSVISRGLYPHFSTNPFWITSSLMIRMDLLKPVSKSMFPLA